MLYLDENIFKFCIFHRQPPMIDRFGKVAAMHGAFKHGFIHNLSLIFAAKMKFSKDTDHRMLRQAAPFTLVACVLLLLLAASGCGSADVEVENVTDYSQDSAMAVTHLPATSDQGEPHPPIDSALIYGLQPCDGFDFPVGPPDAKRYFKARGFLPVGLEHLGEDWNGDHGGNSDFGDFVYAAADGIVFFADHYNNGWGTVIRILHNYGTAEAPKYVETLYAHVASSWVEPGYQMRRGEVIGTIGNAEGKYHAHLHLEMRRKPGKDIRCGYDGDTIGFVDPTAFIEAHRPKRSSAR